MSIARWGLVVSIAAVLAAVVVGVLSDLGVGLTETGPTADALSERIVQAAEAHEEWYLVYGRWSDLTAAVAFAGLLVAAPFIERTRRAVHLIVAGTAIAVVGDAIDLSQLIGIDLARFALDNDLPADFAGANTFRFAINTTSTYVWVSGLLLTGLGMLILARDGSGSWWRAVTGLFGFALIATGLADISGNTQLFQIVQYAMGAFALLWATMAFKKTTGTTSRPSI